MSKLTVAKCAVNLVVAAGVSKVTNDVVTNNTDIDSTQDKVKVMIGMAVLGAIAVDAAQEHVSGRIDDAAEWYQARKEIRAEKKAQKEKEKATEK